MEAKVGRLSPEVGGIDAAGISSAGCICAWNCAGPS